MRDKHILILSLYYPPDLAAGSFRTAALVDALLAQNSVGVTIDILTSVPNRYHSFKSEIPKEMNERVRIERIELPSHRAGMLDQPRAFAQFARSALRFVKGRNYDLVYATSSRLMTAALGAKLAARVDAPLYLDIRDIFVDTITGILPRRIAIPLRPLFSALEKWTINRACRVNLVSEGFAPYFRSRYPGKSFAFFTNGVDDEFVPVAIGDGIPTDRAEGLIRIVYAGNIGEGQGLHAIIPALARRLGGRAEFRVIGDGGRKLQLERALANAGVVNVTLLPPVPRDALIREYAAADVLFLHLNDYEAFEKVLPSKIFEYAASGKPVWAGVSGFSADFLRHEVVNAEVFAPLDVDEALRAFERLDLRTSLRDAFVTKYSRETIMRAMTEDILAHATGAPRR